MLQYVLILRNVHENVNFDQTIGTAITVGRARRRAPRSCVYSYMRSCGFVRIIEAENALFEPVTYILTLKMVHLHNGI